VSDRPLQDPYEYPHYPGVLIKKFDLHSAAQLRLAEAAATAVRLSELEAQSVAGRFDLAHLQAIHHHIFQDVYSWAGELRTIDIAKERSYFASHLYLVSSAQTIFIRLKQERY